jgi:hypothetical protein
MKFVIKFNTLPRQIFSELVVFYLLLCLLGFMTFKVYLNYDGSSVYRTYELGLYSYDFYYLLVCALFISISAFTFSKKLILVNNILVLLILFYSLATNTFFSNIFAIHGPLAPESTIAYFLALFLIFVLWLRSYYWRRKIDKTNSLSKFSYLPKIIIFAIYFYILYFLFKMFFFF